MRILENLEPQDVFYYLEEICKIPHGSGNTGQISDYLKAFADEHGLYCRQDELNNIIMVKEASKGYEDHEPVLLQGHMDMVAVKDADCTIDMTKDGLQLEILGDRLTAKGTSLGGDDGIAVAFGLALLAGEEYRHPRIELILTVDEEVGMEGATGLTVDDLTAKRMINLDQEEEKIFITGCAGGARIDIRKKTETEQVEGVLCKLIISGLQGGHSGQEINKERGNAICLMGRLLAALQEKTPIYLKEVNGGTADNAIPNEVCAEIVVTEWTEDIAAFMEEKFCGLKAEFAGKEDGLKCELQVGAEDALIEAVSYTHLDVYKRQAVSGLIAKENVVATFGLLFGFSEVAEDGAEIWGSLAQVMTPIAAYGFLVFNLLCAPCFAAMGAIKREMNNAKWFWFAIGYQCGLAYIVSLCI